MAGRMSLNRRPAPPPALPGPDELDRTARQVRIPTGVTHTLHAADSTQVGRRYWTACGHLLLAANGAMLTTRDVDCGGCTAIAKLQVGRG